MWLGIVLLFLVDLNFLYCLFVFKCEVIVFFYFVCFWYKCVCKKWVLVDRWVDLLCFIFFIFFKVIFIYLLVLFKLFSLSFVKLSVIVFLVVLLGRLICLFCWVSLRCFLVLLKFVRFRNIFLIFLLSEYWM